MRRFIIFLVEVMVIAFQSAQLKLRLKGSKQAVNETFFEKIIKLSRNLEYFTFLFCKYIL